MGEESVTFGKLRLVLLSFLMLFVELALIRWLGSNVVYLSFFSNFVLLGSFLGIGIGFLRAKARADLFPWAVVALAILIALVRTFPVVMDPRSDSFYRGTLTSGIPMWVILPAIFVAVAVVMACIAQGVGRAFAKFEPLEAYRLDILGSLAGVVGFSLLSFLGAPPVAWGAVVAVAFVVLFRPKRISVASAIAFASAIALVFLLGQESFQADSSWSPYYKIQVFKRSPGTILSGLSGNAIRVSSGYVDIFVNGVAFQQIVPMAERKNIEPIYFMPYQTLRDNPLRNVLIVGAGNGKDVAIALAAGAEHVDAVEIDPHVYQIGRELNPDRPYQQSRVSVHIDDGRAFLERTRSRYDLVLFALPDSLVLISGQSALRLESYLFTVEAMRTVRAHLNPGGAFGMYNYYREDWVVGRLASTMEEAFGQWPCWASAGNGIARFSLLIVGREPSGLACPPWDPQTESLPAPTNDDRPFLYVHDRSIPPLYLVTLAMILLLSLIAIRIAAGPLREMRGYLDLSFMGAAFLLLETKNVVQFALLFGTTWFVNALVFFGVLISVLAAIEVARRVRLRNPSRLYVALFAALALAWAIEPHVLLSLSVSLRFGIAVSLAFAPIFLANLIFAERFRDVGTSTIAFAANLLGAMIGGVLEYASLIVGYRSLLLLVAVLYALAFLFGRKHLAQSA